MHDKAEVLDEILTAHPEMEFVQLQINYADWEDPSIESRKCYEVARKHGKPVIIMEPVKGGTLANPPKEVSEVFVAADSGGFPVLLGNPFRGIAGGGDHGAVGNVQCGADGGQYLLYEGV